MSDLGLFQGISPIAFESVSNVTATPSVEIGARRVFNGEEYVYFCNAMASAATQGIAMTISGLSGYSLTRSSLAGADIAVCFVKHADVPAASYAWGLTRGLVQAHFSSTMTTGVLVSIGLDGIVQTYTTATSFDPGILGKVISAATANGQGLCFVRCFG